jgi:hypothetical protein
MNNIYIHTNICIFMYMNIYICMNIIIINNSIIPQMKLLLSGNDNNQYLKININQEIIFPVIENRENNQDLDTSTHTAKSSSTSISSFFYKKQETPSENHHSSKTEEISKFSVFLGHAPFSNNPVKRALVTLGCVELFLSMITELLNSDGFVSTVRAVSTELPSPLLNETSLGGSYDNGDVYMDKGIAGGSIRGVERQQRPLPLSEGVYLYIITYVYIYPVYMYIYMYLYIHTHMYI